MAIASACKPAYFATVALSDLGRKKTENAPKISHCDDRELWFHRKGRMGAMETKAAPNTDPTRHSDKFRSNPKAKL